MPQADARESVKEYLPEFFEQVKDFPDFQVTEGLTDQQIDEIEKEIDYAMHAQLRDFFKNCGALSMNGLSIDARKLGPIVMPASEALVIGEFYLHNPGDRLLMLPEDAAIYYLEQRNGAITRLAANIKDFFNKSLPRYFYE